MNALGRDGGRPAGIPTQPSPWVETAVGLQNAGLGVRAIAERIKVSVGAVSKWLRRVSGVQAPRVPPKATPESPVSIDRSSENWSLDPDPSDRALDRILARLGKLMDAEPVFIPGRRVPRAGVLLAVPALIQSGIFEAAEEVYGHIGPAF